MNPEGAPAGDISRGSIDRSVRIVEGSKLELRSVLFQKTVLWFWIEKAHRQLILSSEKAALPHHHIKFSFFGGVSNFDNPAVLKILATVFTG